MLTLKFSVEAQKLSADFGDVRIVRGTKNFLKCAFDFKDSSWSGCKIAAVFEVPGQNEYPVAVSHGTCMVPEEVTDGKNFKLKLIGVNRIGYKIVTNKILITQGG